MYIYYYIQRIAVYGQFTAHFNLLEQCMSSKVFLSFNLPCQLFMTPWAIPESLAAHYQRIYVFTWHLRATLR